ncbi:MAG: ATP-binding protein [Trebonia sp.]
MLRLLPAQPDPRAAWASLLPVSEASPARARQGTWFFLANCSGISEDVEDVAVLVVSELVTNACQAMQAGSVTGPACIELSLRRFEDRLLVEVIDSSPKAPVPNLAGDAGAEGGRGLVVVDRLSGEWGWFWRPGRKVVYCVLPLTAGEGN